MNREKSMLSIYARFNILVISVSLSILLMVNAVSAQTQVFGTSVDPDQYITGPGDQFQIDFLTEGSDQIKVTVMPEGFVLLESIGQADIGGLKLTEAKRIISDLIKKYYINVEFTVSLMGVKPVQILVTGAVEKPGMYNGFVSQRASDIIAKAGGLLSGASQRNIEFKSKFYSNIVDLTKFERTGDLNANPYLYSGYHLHVPIIVDSSSFVHISGEVVDPGRFEFKAGDQISDVIDIAFGLSGLEGDLILISRNTNGLSEALKYAVDKINVPVQPGDKITVSKSDRPYSSNYFIITGEVHVPGVYSYDSFNSGLNCKSAIDLAGGLNGFSDLCGISIYRKTEILNTITNKSLTNLIGRGSSPVVIDKNLISDRLGTVSVMPGDSINIPKRTGFVNVGGMVQNPGLLTYSKAMSAKSFVDLAGGFSPGADKKRVELIRKSTGLKSVVSRATIIYDGDIIMALRDEKQTGTIGKIKDYFIIIGGAALTYLALDKMAD